MAFVRRDIFTFFFLQIAFVMQLSAIKYEFGGAPRVDMAFDTRRFVGTDDGATILYPAAPDYDTNCQDIKAEAAYGMTPALSKFFLKVSDVVIKNCSLMAHVEGDFSGVYNAEGSNTYTTGLFELYYAYIKAQWPKKSILVGNTEHPLYPDDCSPNCVGYHGGIPMVCYTRLPQIRMEYQAGSFQFGLTPYSHFLFPSMGPIGYSRSYMRHSMAPGLCANVFWRNSSTIMGFLFDVKQLKPATYTTQSLDLVATPTMAKKYVTNQKITSVIGSAILGFDVRDLHIKNQVILGQNGTDFSTLGGYAVSCYAPVTGACTYTNINFLSLWTDWEYGKYENFTPGFFVGLVKNLGARQPVYLDPTTGQPIFYGFDSQLDMVFRLAPRITATFYNFYIGCEFDCMWSWFGAMNCCGKQQHTQAVNGVRVLLQAHYDF